MIHINSYFEIDWEASADNLKGLLKGKVTYGVLAEAMCVDPKTVYNWINHKSEPSLDNLVLLAKFLNVDILDILVTKGERKQPLIYSDVKEALDEECKASAKLAEKDIKNDFPCKESVIATVIFNEYQRKNTKISSLNEFLLYLPLFEPYCLVDALYRINGNLRHNQDYVEKQLDCLYQKTPVSPAKSYADMCRYFYLTSPSVYGISENTKDTYKIQKFNEYRIWSWDSDTKKAALDYERKYSEFLERLMRIEMDAYAMEGGCENDDNL